MALNIPNVDVEECPGFNQIGKSIAQLEATGKSILQAIALHLQLPENYLTTMSTTAIPFAPYSLSSHYRRTQKCRPGSAPWRHQFNHPFDGSTRKRLAGNDQRKYLVGCRGRERRTDYQHGRYDGAIDQQPTKVYGAPSCESSARIMEHLTLFDSLFHASTPPHAAQLSGQLHRQ